MSMDMMSLVFSGNISICFWRQYLSIAAIVVPIVDFWWRKFPLLPRKKLSVSHRRGPIIQLQMGSDTQLLNGSIKQLMNSMNNCSHSCPSMFWAIYIKWRTLELSIFKKLNSKKNVSYQGSYERKILTESDTNIKEWIWSGRITEPYCNDAVVWDNWLFAMVSPCFKTFFQVICQVCSTFIS